MSCCAQCGFKSVATAKEISGEKEKKADGRWKPYVFLDLLIFLWPF